MVSQGIWDGAWDSGTFPELLWYMAPEGAPQWSSLICTVLSANQKNECPVDGWFSYDATQNRLENSTDVQASGNTDFFKIHFIYLFN